jgi:mono/diheme cytochrome c family protein
MSVKPQFSFWGSAVVSALGLGALVAGQTPKSSERQLADRARTILREHCFACHGQDAENVEGNGLDILDHKMLIEREIVVPKQPDKSSMIRKIENGTMPPPGEASPVPPEQIKILRSWIQAGARPPLPKTR